MTGSEMIDATNSYAQQAAEGKMTQEEADESIRLTLERYREEQQEESRRFHARMDALGM